MFTPHNTIDNNPALNPFALLNDSRCWRMEEKCLREMNSHSTRCFATSVTSSVRSDHNMFGLAKPSSHSQESVDAKPHNQTNALDNNSRR